MGRKSRRKSGIAAQAEALVEQVTPAVDAARAKVLDEVVPQARAAGRKARKQAAPHVAAARAKVVDEVVPQAKVAGRKARKQAAEAARIAIEEAKAAAARAAAEAENARKQALKSAKKDKRRKRRRRVTLLALVGGAVGFAVARKQSGSAPAEDWTPRATPPMPVPEPEAVVNDVPPPPAPLNGSAADAVSDPLADPISEGAPAGEDGTFFEQVMAENGEPPKRRRTRKTAKDEPAEG